MLNMGEEPVGPSIYPDQRNPDCCRPPTSHPTEDHVSTGVTFGQVAHSFMSLPPMSGQVLGVKSQEPCRHNDKHKLVSLIGRRFRFIGV